MMAVPASFASRWRRAVATVPDRTFLMFESNDGNVAKWTYSQFDRLVREVAGGLVAAGVGPADIVHVTLPNSPAFVATWLAATGLGAVFVPSDPKSTGRELQDVFERTPPVVGICQRDSTEYRRAADQVGLSTVEVEADDVFLDSLRGEAVQWTEVPMPEALDTAALMFTSGTTSRPKAVVVTQANYAFAGDVMAAAAGLTGVDRQLVVLPMFHANAQYYSFASAIAVGASVALVAKFSASSFVEQCIRHGATHASLFAAPIRMILARTDATTEPAKLRNVWYAQNLSADEFQRISKLLSCRPRQLYGMTETIPAVLTSQPLATAPDVMGSPTLGCEVLLADGDGTPVPAGAVGEVRVAGRLGIELFNGYWDDGEATRRSFDGRWFRTGDLARRDEDANFRFVGRGSDILKVAGENVSVAEIETVIAEHPSVFDAAVVGVPDDVRDEVPIACVVVAESAPVLQVDDVLNWCRDRLSPAKRPVDVVFLEELPRTSVGKIRRHVLQSSLLERHAPTEEDS